MKYISAPKAQLILDYAAFFTNEPPKDRLSIIKNISKEHILFELVGLNYRLKPKNRISFDSSLKSQVKELKYFTKSEELYAKYAQVCDKYTKSKNDYPIIFNRQACIFAIEEIINTNELKTDDNFDMTKGGAWEIIIKYLLAVNSEITQIKEEKDDRGIDFESLNPKLLPLNELSVETDPIFTLYRGFWLIDYLLNNPDFSAEIQNYFRDLYGIDAHYFIFLLMKMFLGKSSDNPDFHFFYLLKEGDEIPFEKLSTLFPSQETFKLISIRKSPFIKVGSNKYLLSDNTFLIEKAYSQFLNDFWFDRIQTIKESNGRQKFPITFYRSTFGYFFENYISKTLKKCFENYKYSTLLMFKELRVNTVKGKIEIADIYFRNGNKIILGQVKSGSIYDKEKYGGSAETLYRKGRDSFFENFGVNQIVNSIKNMDDYIEALDNKFPKGHSYVVYPWIIINDKALQTGLMADTFNVRFQELFKNSNTKKIKVKPLMLVHISDLEVMEEFLKKKPGEIWDLLDCHFKDKKFVPPFYITINQNLDSSRYPERILTLFKELIQKYNPPNTTDTV